MAANCENPARLRARALIVREETHAIPSATGNRQPATGNRQLAIGNYSTTDNSLAGRLRSYARSLPREVKYRFSHCDSPSRPGKRTRSVMFA
jgi:hypothetical protein